MDVVPRGVVQHLMLSKVLPGLEHGPSRSLCVPHWVHEAPPAAGTWVKQRRHSCSLSLSQQAGGTDRSRFGARDVGVQMPLPSFPFLLPL